MPLKLKNNSELWKLVDSIKQSFSDRDEVWKNRRKVRYRRMEDDLKALPLNPRVADQALMVHQSEVPNQETHLRTKRLVANKPRFEVVIYDDEPSVQRLGQELEDGIKALYTWMNRGRVPFDWMVTQFQQGDGLGIGKAVFVPGHGDALAAYDADRIVEDDEKDTDNDSKKRNRARSEYRSALTKTDDESKAYDKVTENVLMKELPPFRVVAVDPTVCYWWEDDDGIEVIVECSEKLLNPLIDAFSDYGVRMDESKSRLYVEPSGSDVVGAGSVPIHDRKELAAKVTYVEIRTRHEIAILIEHPKLNERLRGARPRNSDERGIILTFDNPFGPYTTGYVLVPGDVSTEATEADRFQPPTLAALNSAQSLNVLMTAQLSAALESALAAPYVHVKPEDATPPSDESKSPEAKEGEVPYIPGEIKRVQEPSVELERVGDRLAGEEAPYRFREALLGDATSDTSGHRLAIQVAQADIQMVPYQNARADAIKELMMGILYAVKKHGLSIYIPTLPDTRRKGKSGQLRVVNKARLSPDMAELDFDLVVTLGAETPTTKYAKQAAMREQEEAGIIGYESLVEESAENPEDEIQRVYEGKMLKETMEQLIPETVNMVVSAVKRRLDEFLNPPIPEEQMLPPEGGIQPELPFGMTPESGLMNAGGPPATDMSGQLAGVGMPVAPSTSEYGPAIVEPAGVGQVPM